MAGCVCLSGSGSLAYRASHQPDRTNAPLHRAWPAQAQAQARTPTAHLRDPGHPPHRLSPHARTRAQGQGIYAFVSLMAGVAASEALRKELIAAVRKTIGAFAAPDVIHWGG